jgi:hypothetical protein
LTGKPNEMQNHSLWEKDHHKFFENKILLQMNDTHKKRIETTNTHSEIMSFLPEIRSHKSRLFEERSKKKTVETVARLSPTTYPK